MHFPVSVAPHPQPPTPDADDAAHWPVAPHPHPLQFIGSEAVWAAAERSLAECLERTGRPYTIQCVPCRKGRDWIGLDWMGWVGLGWVGLGWVGLGWIGLDGMGFAFDWIGGGLLEFDWRIDWNFFVGLRWVGPRGRHPLPCVT
jgi:hypothetical protein